MLVTCSGPCAKEDGGHVSGAAHGARLPAYKTPPGARSRGIDHNQPLLLALHGHPSTLVRCPSLDPRPRECCCHPSIGPTPELELLSGSVRKRGRESRREERRKEKAERARAPEKEREVSAASIPLRADAAQPENQRAGAEIFILEFAMPILSAASFTKPTSHGATKNLTADVDPWSRSRRSWPTSSRTLGAASRSEHAIIAQGPPEKLDAG